MDRTLDIYDITPEQAQIHLVELQSKLFCAEDNLQVLRGEICRWLDMTNQEMRLICGELTVQEIRSIKAVIKHIYAKIS